MHKFYSEFTSWEVVVDAIERESGEQSAVVTDSPVEDGGSIATHVRFSPAKRTFDILVTDSPVVVPPTQNRGVRREPVDVITLERFSYDDDGKRSTSSIATLQGGVLSGPLLRVADVYDSFIAQMLLGEPVAFESNKGTFGGYVITSVSDTQAADGVARFTVILTQVRLAETDTGKKLKPKPKKPSGRNKKKKGKQAGKDGSASGSGSDSTNASLLSNLLGKWL
jgi:hypothetical protein